MYIPYKFSSSVSRRRCKHGAIHLALYSPIIIFLSCVSGVLFRFKGGWHPGLRPAQINLANETIFEGILLHNAALRWPVGFFLALVCVVFASTRLDISRRIVLFFSFFFAISLGFYVDHTTYQSAGYGYKNGPTWGLFDFIVGNPQPEFASVAVKMFRDVTGMCLCGLLQTALPGFVLHLYGYGSEYSLSGVTMGWIYAFGHLKRPMWPGIHKFRTSVEVSEFIWGFWILFVLVISLMTHLKTNERHTKSAKKHLFCRVFIYVFEGISMIIFVAAIIWFVVKARPVSVDKINWGQTLLGVCVQALGVLVISSTILFVPIFRMCRKQTFSDIQLLGTSPYQEDYQAVINFTNDDSDEFDTDVGPSGDCLALKKFSKFIIPQGLAPWKFILFVIRVVNGISWIAFLVLLGFALSNNYGYFPDPTNPPV